MRKRNYNLLSMEKTDLAIGELIRKKLKEMVCKHLAM